MITVAEKVFVGLSSVSVLEFADLIKVCYFISDHIVSKNLQVILYPVYLFRFIVTEKGLK